MPYFEDSLIIFNGEIKTTQIAQIYDNGRIYKVSFKNNPSQSITSLTKHVLLAFDNKSTPSELVNAVATDILFAFLMQCNISASSVSTIFDIIPIQNNKLFLSAKVQLLRE